MKAATRMLKRRIEQGKISIHAAREGGDSLCLFIFARATRISIHAAREGGDETKERIEYDDIEFQSTPPVKAATVKHVLV